MGFIASIMTLICGTIKPFQLLWGNRMPRKNSRRSLLIKGYVSVLSACQDEEILMRMASIIFLIRLCQTEGKYTDNLRGNVFTTLSINFNCLSNEMIEYEYLRRSLKILFEDGQLDPKAMLRVVGEGLRLPLTYRMQNVFSDLVDYGFPKGNEISAALMVFLGYAFLSYASILHSRMLKKPQAFLPGLMFSRQQPHALRPQAVTSTPLININRTEQTMSPMQAMSQIHAMSPQLSAFFPAYRPSQGSLFSNDSDLNNDEELEQGTVNIKKIGSDTAFNTSGKNAFVATPGSPPKQRSLVPTPPSTPKVTPVTPVTPVSIRSLQEEDDSPEGSPISMDKDGFPKDNTTPNSETLRFKRRINRFERWRAAHNNSDSPYDDSSNSDDTPPRRNETPNKNESEDTGIRKTQSSVAFRKLKW